MTNLQAAAVARKPNRKQRRQADKRARQAGHGNRGATAPDNVGLLTTAVNEHKAGNLDRAEVAYRQVLERDAHDVNALRLLGTVLNAKGRTDEALPLLQQAVEAEPERYANHNNLAVALMAVGRLDEAADHCHQAIAIDASCPDAHKNLAAIFSQQKRLDQAAACFETLVRLDPTNPRPHASLAFLLDQLGRKEEALSHLERVLELDPANGKVRPQLAVLLIDLKRPQEAMAQITMALDENPQSRMGQLAFQRLITTMPPISYAESVERALTACFDGKNVSYNQLANVAANQIKLKFAARQRIADPSDGPVAPGQVKVHLDGILADPLLIRLLDHAINTDKDLEFLLTAIRSSVLFTARQQSSLQPSMLRFLVVLAKQCRHNSYAFFVEDREMQEVEALEREIGDDLRQSQAPSTALEVKLALFAMYRPLHHLDCFAAVQSIPTAQWSDDMQALIKLALLDPQEEERIKATLPVIGEISDEISQAVRSQYEENPYPRWFGLPDVEKMTLGQYLHRTYPWYIPPERFHRPLQVLVAGCGTGQHPISAARHYANAEIMAIDLSRASLAYASRMAQELGVDNITFHQADILGLSCLGRQFPAIECAGVLHHMREPEQGLEVLLGLLEPGGLIKLGLYSELARRDIVALRKRIAELELTPTAENIRHFRRQILRGVEFPGTGATGFTDFYDLDSCRDLLFHVQEHRFTIPQLKALFERQSLEFMGFVFNGPARLNAYRECFPDDPEMRDLDRWAQFEEQHPDTFTSMYQFYCRKPG